MNAIKTAAIIVGAGRGTRMGGVDKLFIHLAGYPVVWHTLSRFDKSEYVVEIVLVVREDNKMAFEDFLNQYNFSKPVRLVTGGALRQDSVWNGINAVSDEIEVVAIHDGARPCIALETINKTIQFACEHGAAVAAKKVTDTIKESLDGITISRNVERSNLWSVQTPQCFRVDIIRRAMNAVNEKGIVITDDTSACEIIGVPVRLVEDPYPNPKLTIQNDIPYLEFLLNSNLNPFRAL